MRCTTLIEGQDVPVEVPSKYITEVVDLEMRCKVFFVDLEGVHDGRATKNIIPHINPRRMVRYILKPWFLSLTYSRSWFKQWKEQQNPSYRAVR